jgi:hypothetical protein
MDASGEYAVSGFYEAHPNNYAVANRPYSNPMSECAGLGPLYGALFERLCRPTGFGEGYRLACGNWSFNQSSVGIEHEGYFDNPSWFTDAMFRSSAKLTAYLANKYHIPTDRAEKHPPYEPPVGGLEHLFPRNSIPVI